MEVGKNRQSHSHSSVDSRMRNRMNRAIFFAFINGMRNAECDFFAFINGMRNAECDFF